MFGSRQTRPGSPQIAVSLRIAAPPGRVVRAFFDGGALHAWWQVARSVTTPRALGPFVVEWPATDFYDETLGRLGGVLRGTVMQFDGDRGFFVADLFWLPPDGEPIGPMAFEVNCTPATDVSEPATDLQVTQTGFEESARWRRYYEIVGPGLERALNAMKMLLEK